MKNKGRSEAVGDRSVVVLLTENDPGAARLQSSWLAEGGFDVITLPLGDMTWNALADLPDIDVAIIDFDVPEVKGLDVVERIKTERSDLCTIATTKNGSLTSAIKTIRAGAFDYLIKPINAGRLVEAVQTAAGRISMGKPAYVSIPGKVKMLGSSPAISRVGRIIQKAASSSAPVFITGESGTGKEVCAELIHWGSKRAGKSLIAFNCSALPRDLVESEIFGHVKGAFTGATSDRPGAALLAHGGTLFLDEICEMDPALQAKLLRFLQNGRVRRLGATTEEQVDARIICATNRDPLNEVKAGRFREDLYYRLHVVPIEMPPLRERDGDAVELAKLFVDQYSSQEKRGDMRLSACAEKAIAAYSWPGNVRQLQNMIRSAVVFNDGQVLTVDAFPELIRPHPPSVCVRPDGHRPDAPVLQVHNALSLGRPRTLAEVERYAIERSMEIHNNNIAVAAAALKISPSTIYRKLQAWNKAVEKPGERM